MNPNDESTQPKNPADSPEDIKKRSSFIKDEDKVVKEEKSREDTLAAMSDEQVDKLLKANLSGAEIEMLLDRLINKKLGERIINVTPAPQLGGRPKPEALHPIGTPVEVPMDDLFEDGNTRSFFCFSIGYAILDATNFSGNLDPNPLRRAVKFRNVLSVKVGDNKYNNRIVHVCRYDTASKSEYAWLKRIKPFLVDYYEQLPGNLEKLDFEEQRIKMEAGERLNNLDTNALVRFANDKGMPIISDPVEFRQSLIPQMLMEVKREKLLAKERAATPDWKDMNSADMRRKGILVGSL